MSILKILHLGAKIILLIKFLIMAFVKYIFEVRLQVSERLLTAAVVSPEYLIFFTRVSKIYFKYIFDRNF